MEILVEFLAKLQRKKQKTQEDIAWDEAQKLINEDYKPEDDVEVGLREVILDINSFNDLIHLEDDYIQVVVNNSRVYILKMNWEIFKTLYQQLTHKNIIEVSEVKE